MYFIVYTNGACQFTDKEDVPTWSSLLSARAIVMVVDSEDKRAFIGNDQAGKFTVGWAPIPEYGKFTVESED